MAKRDKRGRLHDKYGHYIKNEHQRVHAPKKGKGGRFVSSKPLKKTSGNGITLDPKEIERELEDLLSNEVEGVSVSVEPVKAKYNRQWHDYLISWENALDPSNEDSDDWSTLDTIISVSRDILTEHYHGRVWFRSANEFDPPNKGERIRKGETKPEWITLNNGMNIQKGFNGLKDKFKHWAKPGSKSGHGTVPYRITLIKALSILCEAPLWYRQRGADKNETRLETRGKGKARGNSKRKPARNNRKRSSPKSVGKRGHKKARRVQKSGRKTK